MKTYKVTLFKALTASMLYNVKVQAQSTWHAAQMGEKLATMDGLQVDKAKTKVEVSKY